LTLNRALFWPAFVNPSQTVQALAWLKRAPEAIVAARGEHGESALHWSAMANLGLMTDLIALGLSPNTPDGTGKTPLDWLNDRLWHVCVERKGDLREGARYRIRHESEALIQALWRMGGRPGSETQMNPAQVWTRVGAWSLVDMRVDLEGPSALRGWGVRHESVLHGWTLAPDMPEKYRRLEAWLAAGLTVDEPDAAGRTPLWYAIDAWALRPAWARTLTPAIRALVHQGADLDRGDLYGVSPRAKAKAAHLRPEEHDELMAALMAAEAADNGVPLTEHAPPSA
jgi:hypothetical protein